MSKGEYRQAIPLFVLALRHGPEHQYTYYNRAQIHCRNGYYKGAILELDQALRVDPNFSEAYHFRGLLHFKKGKLEAARSDLNQALRIAPRNGHAELYRDRASLCLRGVDANYCRYMEGFSCDWTLRFARAGKLKGLIPFFGRYHK